MSYLLISRQNIKDVQLAGKNLLTMLSDENNLAIVENTLLYIIREVKKGKSFKIRAINGDTTFIINGNEYKLEYKEDKQRVSSIFIFLVETINKWQILPGNKSWQVYNEEVFRKLERLLHKSEL